MRRETASSPSAGTRAFRDRLVHTHSSAQPPLDATEARWRARPVLAGAVRVVVILAPLAASVGAGIAASRLFRPEGWVAWAAWLIWVAGVSFAVLAVVDAVVRRLLPLQRLLQLCLVFPDRAPSRLRIAARASRRRRPEQLATADGVPRDAADAASRIVELLAALATHDRRTRGHSERVCAYTELLAKEMELPARDRDRLTWVSLIHDIGKLHVPSRLLNKPGRPTVPEWQVLQAHPAEGDRIVSQLRAWLGPWADAVLQHHEQYDGRGYPHGLRGTEICLGARIIAVTDAFEVMTAPRAYRRAVDAQTARSELARRAGTQFDPDVVRHFLAIGLPVLRRSMGLLSVAAQIPLLRAWPRLQAPSTLTTAQAASVTAAASSAGMLLLAPAGQLPVAATHADNAVHTSVQGQQAHAIPQLTASTSTRPAQPQAQRRPHHAATSHRNAETTAGDRTSGAVTTPTAPVAATAEPTTPATPTAGCDPTPRGRHRGWSHPLGNDTATNATQDHRHPQRHRDGPGC